MDFNNINYKEINDYKQQEKDPLLFIRHFQCTLDKKSGKMVKDETGEFVISTAAIYALEMEFYKYETKFRKYIKRLNFMEVILFIAVALNLLSAIINFIHF